MINFELPLRLFICSDVLKCTQLKEDYEARNVRQESFEISRGRGGTTYDGLYGEALPERGIFFRLQVYERVGVSIVVVY